MDLSEIYIKKCEKAAEIQDYCLERWAKSDFHYSFIDYLDNEKAFYLIKAVIGNSRIWWLPRQDQLQEIVMKSCEHPVFLVTRFFNFVIKAEVMHFHSIEELWLAFVMKERYGKIWDGKDWIAANLQ